MRAAAHVVPGCPVSMPVDPLVAEAGMFPARGRRKLLAARLACTAASQRRDDPPRIVAEAKVPRRILHGLWRPGPGRRCGVSVEERLHVTIQPWADGAMVHFRLNIGVTIIRDRPDTVRRRAAETHLAILPADAVWV